MLTDCRILTGGSKESPKLSITSDNFRSMLDDYRIPFKTWHENGRHAHAFDDYSHIGTSECPTSLGKVIHAICYYNNYANGII